MVQRLRPLADRVLVRKLEQTTRQVGSIVLPESAMEKLSQGVVIAVGPGSRNPCATFPRAPLHSHKKRLPHSPGGCDVCSTTGERFPVGLKPGDKVLLPEFGGVSFKIDNDKYSIFNEADILCVLHDE